jgi:hypothetical protein
LHLGKPKGARTNLHKLTVITKRERMNRSPENVRLAETTSSDRGHRQQAP